MTGTPIKLNKARKARAKAQRRAQADENAVKFGRSKVEKTRDTAENKRSASELDRKKLDR